MKKIKELFKKQSKKILFFWITLGTLVTTSIAGIISIITILTKKSKTNFSNFSEDKKLNNSDKDYLTTLPLDENPKGVQNLDKNLSEKNLLNTKSLAKKSDDENISISKDLGKINPSIKTGNDKKILENKNQNPSIFVKTPNNNSLNNKNQTDTSSDLNILKNENKDQNSEVLNKDNNYLNDKNINKSINSDKKTEKNKKNTEQFSKTSLENTISTVEDKQNSKIKNQKDVTFEKTKKTLIPESKPKEDEIEKIDDSNIDYESKSEQPINDINSKLSLENEHINNSQLKEDTKISDELDALKTEKQSSELKTKKIESKPKEDEIEKIDDSNIDYESKSEQPINDINSKLSLENEHINNSQLKEDTKISDELDALKTEKQSSELKTKKIESKPKEDEIEKIDDSNIDYEIKSEQPINDINSKLPLENEHINNSQLKEDTNISNELDILKTENEKSEDLTNNKINEQSQLETAELDKKIKKKQVIFILGHEQDNIVLEYNPDDIEKTFNLPEVPIVDGFDFTGWKYKNSDKNFLKPEQNESDIIEVEAHYKQYWKITYDLNSAEFKNESYFPKKYYEDNIDTEISKLFDSINIKKNFKFEYGDIQNLIVDNYVGDGEGVFDYDEFKENHLNQLKDLHVFVVLPITDKVLFNVIVKYENLDGSINEEWSDDENIENKSPSHYGRIGKRISVNRYNETIGINNVISTCPGCFERSWYKIVVEDKEYQRAEFEKDLENNLPILKKDGTTTLFVYYKGLIDPIPNRIKT